MKRNIGSHMGTLLNGENLLPFILVTALFLFWGIPSSMNDILIKQFMKSFELNRLEAGFIQSAFYMGYFILAIPAGLIMRRYGYKTGLLIGLMLFSVGTLLFWPAALMGKFSIFLIALFIIASGLSFLETGANPFVATLGDSQSSERRLNFAQAFNPLGAIVGVGIGTIFILSGIEHSEDRIAAMKMAGTYGTYLQSETMRVITPYVILGIVVSIWGILIFATKFPETLNKKTLVKDKSGAIRLLLNYPHFYKGVLAQFFYVGAQVGTWSFFIQYIQDFTGGHEKLAGSLLTGTLIAFAVGRFSATWLMRFIKPARLMSIYGIINVLLVSIAVIIPGWVGVWSIFLTSFFMSLMFPTIFAMGIKGLGENTKLGGSFMVMAIIGGAVFPPLMGVISDQTGSMAIAMLLPLICYIVVVWYAMYGSKMVETNELPI